MRLSPDKTALWKAPKRRANGSVADHVKSWPEQGIFDIQLGPTRDGQKW